MSLWLGAAMFALIAALCWCWWHAGVEWMRDALMREFRDEGIPR